MQLSVRDALNSALDDELARDENVFVLGEEVQRMTASLSDPHKQSHTHKGQSKSQCTVGGRIPGGLQGERLPGLCRSKRSSQDRPTHQLHRCWQITRGLLQKYGAERIRDTPITEASHSQRSSSSSRPP